MLTRGQGVIDDYVASTLPAEAARPQNTRSPSGGGAPFASGAVEASLQWVESRLIALAGGDPVLEGDVRRYVAESCARFATARVRQFVPILVEREVRDRLRAGSHAGAGDRTPAEGRAA
jgi:hypothetical protein